MYAYCKKNTFVHLNNVTFLGHFSIKKNKQKKNIQLYIYRFDLISFQLLFGLVVAALYELLFSLFFALALLYYIILITHTHTCHQTSLQPYLYVPSTEPSLHLFCTFSILKETLKNKTFTRDLQSAKCHHFKCI